MGSDGLFPPHPCPRSALYGAYSGLSGEGGPKAQVGQWLLSCLRRRRSKKALRY
jgi:hypothetical protein